MTTSRQPRAIAALALVFIFTLATAAQATPVTFRLATDGSSVHLAGDFNSWSDSSDKMTDDNADGIFEVTLNLDPGTHAYKYVVDGTWMEDPHSPAFTDDGFGGKNSVIEVSGVAMVVGEGTGSAGGGGVAVALPKPGETSATPTQRKVHFAVEAPGAASVYVAGEFNGWNDSADKLSDDDADGFFEIVLTLDVGRYQ